jgi:hypothetical protein
MRTFLICMSCLICMTIGMFLGAYLVILGGTDTAAAVVECIKQPDSCGMEDDDLDPSVHLIET